LQNYVTFPFKEAFVKAEQALALTLLTNKNHLQLERLERENSDLKGRIKQIEAEVSSIKMIQDYISQQENY
jgi:uncharacterized protein (UPF0335 family)